MPGMTPLPILQSAPPVSTARPLAGNSAPSNRLDTANPPIASPTPDAATGTKTESTDDVAKTGEIKGADSFAKELQRQLAQPAAHDTSVPDAGVISLLALPMEPATAAVVTFSPQPVSVEALLSDLSRFADRQPQEVSAVSVAPELASATEILATTAADQLLETNPRTRPIDTEKVNLAVEAVAVLKTAIVAVNPAESASQPISINLPATTELTIPSAIPKVAPAAKHEDAPQEAPVDALAVLAPFMQANQQTDVAKQTVGLPVDDKQSNESDLGADGTIASPAVPLPVQVAARTPVNVGNMPTATTEVLPEPTTKSAEIAAPKTILPEPTNTHAFRNESLEPDKTFDALLSAAQSLNQQRTAGIHASTGANAQLPVQTPVGVHGWNAEVGDKLVWMVGRQQQRAELVLNPPQLGRVEVSLSMSDGQTSAQFVSANPAVRDALEAAMPRLREILADAGISLGQTHVGAETGNNAGNSPTNTAENRDNSGRGLGKDELSPSAEILRQIDAPHWIRRGNGLVDTFA